MKYLTFLLTLGLFAQEDASVTTGSIGTVTINGQIYNQLSLRPEIPFGKLGVGLDIYLYLNICLAKLLSLVYPMRNTHKTFLCVAKCHMT